MHLHNSKGKYWTISYIINLYQAHLQKFREIPAVHPICKNLLKHGNLEYLQIESMSLTKIPDWVNTRKQTIGSLFHIHFTQFLIYVIAEICQWHNYKE